MSNKIIVILIFLIFIIIPLIIKNILEREDKKEVKVLLPNKLPSIDLLTNNNKNSLKEILKITELNNIEIPIGINDKNKIIKINFNTINNLLVIGTTSSGKSNFIDEIIMSIIMTKTSNEIKLLTIDTSIVELSHFNNIPHYIKDTIINPIDIIEGIDNLLIEVDKREIDNNNIPLLVIIDDIYDVITYDNRMLYKLEKLLNRGNKVGIYFIFVTDTPTEELLNEKLIKEIDGVVYFNLSPGSSDDFNLNLNKNDLDYLSNKGNAIYKTDNIKEKIIIPEISDEEINIIKKELENN